MAEGGIAAALGNVDARDNWKVHFRDTMRGGKFLNVWRMAELHAKQAPDRVQRARGVGRGLRPHEGRADQPAQLRRPPLPAARARRRPHGARADPHAAGPRRPSGHRLPHGVHGRARCCSTAGAIAGVAAYWRETGRFVLFRVQGRHPRDRRRRQGLARSRATPGSTPATASRWRTTPGAELMDIEFTQFHPTGMVWPPSVRGTLVTEGVRGDGGILLNSEGKRFMFDYVPERFAPETADTEEEANRWLDGRQERAAAARAPDPRRGRARHPGRGQGGPGLAARAARSSTSPRAAPPSSSSASSRRCTTSSRSSPRSTSPRSRWRSGRRCTTSWAASASTPTRR